MKTIIGFILLPLGIGCLVMAFASFQIRDLQERPFEAKKEPLALAYALADFFKSMKGEEKQLSKATLLIAAIGFVLTVLGVVLIKS